MDGTVPAKRRKFALLLCKFHVVLNHFIRCDALQKMKVLSEALHLLRNWTIWLLNNFGRHFQQENRKTSMYLMFAKNVCKSVKEIQMSNLVRAAQTWRSLKSSSLRNSFEINVCASFKGSSPSLPPQRLGSLELKLQHDVIRWFSVYTSWSVSVKLNKYNTEARALPISSSTQYFPNNGAKL